MSDEGTRPTPPSILRRLATDEYEAPAYDPAQRRAVDEVVTAGPDAARRVHRPLGDYWSSRLGTAAGLLALNESAGDRYYVVPDDAAFDQGAADAALGGDEVVIDVQTHYMAPREALAGRADPTIASYRRWAPEWWTGLDGLTYYGFADYVRSVFLESETAVAVLTSPPADETGLSILDNAEMAGTRALIDRFAGTGRLLNHTVVHPSQPEVLDLMQHWRDTFHPVAWKVYTTGTTSSTGGKLSDGSSSPSTGFMLDDERTGVPFLERARELGVTTICSHKGLSGQVDNGSPRDIGPSAAAFPDLDFLVYHSGFEVGVEEGPYDEGRPNGGIDRLIESVSAHGIGRGGNVYAELGSTWFCLVKRPLEAAHALGKLLLAFGEDNVLWGTDSMWYGATQPVIDAFRAFRIPEELRARYGYPELTPAIKEKILGRNAARVYGLDLDAVRDASRTDSLAWTKAAIEAAQAG